MNRGNGTANRNPEHEHGTGTPEPETSTVILAGVSTRAAAESAARAGYDVTAFDAYADLDQHPAVTAQAVARTVHGRFSPHRAARAARNQGADAAVYLSNFENHPGAVAVLARDRALWGNAPSVLARVRDPFDVARALTRRGFAVPAIARPDTSLRTQTDEDIALRANEWMIKPRRSGGGRGVRVWRPASRIPADAYLQARIHGIAGSIVFVADGRHAVPLGISRQLAGDAAFGAHGFQYCGSVVGSATALFRDACATVAGRKGPPYESGTVAGDKGSTHDGGTMAGGKGSTYDCGTAGDRRASGRKGPPYDSGDMAARKGPPYDRVGEVNDAVVEIAHRLADAVVEEYGLIGVNGIDFVVSAGVPWPIEINPRWCASMELVERAYGISVFGAHADACGRGILPTIDSSTSSRRSRVVGKAIVFARHRLRVGHTHAWLGDADIRDIPNPGDEIGAGQPICTVLADATTFDECHAALVSRASGIHRMVSRWRTEAA